MNFNGGFLYQTDKYEIGVTVPPFHPNCRGTTCPYFEELKGYGKRVARDKDGKVYTVPADMTYQEWKKKSVDGEDKKGLENAEKSDTIEARGMAMGMRTSPFHILTDEEITSLKEDAASIEVPLDILRFNEGGRTSFKDKKRVINVRGDVLPDLSSTHNRDRMSSRAVLAHEYYGHYLNHPSKFKMNDWRDEFRASYDAALHAPNLTDEERASLMIDAFDRAKEAGKTVKYNTVARRIIYGYE